MMCYSVHPVPGTVAYTLACAVPALYQHILVPMRCPVPRYGCLAYGIAYVMPGIDIVHNASAISSTDPAYDPTQALAAAALSDCW